MALRLSAPDAAALVLGLLALLLTGSVFGLAGLQEAIPGAADLSLATPLLLLATALGLAGAHAPDQRPALGNASRACAMALVIAGAAYLFENLTGIALGIDLRHGRVPTPLDPTPGRLSTAAAAGFAATGLALLQLRRTATPARRAGYVLLGVLVALLGFGSLLGHVLRLEGLYRVATANRIQPATAFGLAVAAAGLWSLYERMQSFDAATSERRIVRRTTIVLTMLSISSGVAGFSVLRDTFEQSIAQNLQLTATTSAASIANTLDLALLLSRTLAMRASVRQALARLESNPRDDEARAQLDQSAAAFLTADLSAVRFQDVHGAVVASAGSAVADEVELRHALNVNGQKAELAWRKGYLLLTENDVVVDGRRTGRLLTEQRLPLLDQLLEEVRLANDSSDVAICGVRDGMALCAPTRFRRAPFQFPLLDARGAPTMPVVRGLRGERGVVRAVDMRGIEVVSAYAPVKDFGLGLAVKTDVSTLYAPLRSKLLMLAAVLALIVAIGLYAERSQVRPLLSRLAADERRLNAILEEQSELVSLARPDGELVYVNPAYERFFGESGELGKNLFEQVDPRDRELVRTQLSELLAIGRTLQSENRVIGADGTARWVAWTDTVQRDPAGQPLLHSVGRDVTERKLAELQTQRQAATLRSVTEAIPAVVAVVGEDLHYRFANSAFERWAGLDRQAIVGRHMREVLGTAEYERSLPWIERVLAGETVSFEKEHSAPAPAPAPAPVRHMAITYIPLWLNDRVDGFVAVALDITEHRLEARRLLKLAQRDPLTGLLNRAGFEHFLQARQDGDGQPMAVLYIDLDRFKPVNDTHGHPVGDELLRQFAQRLAKSVRPTDAVARLGGDEFAIVLCGVREPARIEAVAEQIVATSKRPFEIGGLTIEVSASVGVAHDPDGRRTRESLIAEADERLYRAKDAGRGRYV